MAAEYPYSAFNFKVTIDGINVVAGFSECSGLTMDNDVIEYRAGSDLPHMQKIPGLRKYTNIVLKRGFSKDDQLFKWRKRVIDSKAGDNFRCPGQIALLKEGGTDPALVWSFKGGWPSKLEGPSFNAKNSEVAIESLEIVVETLEFEAKG